MNSKYLPWKKTGKFTLSSGQIVDSYYDLKEMLGNPKLLEEETYDIMEKSKKHNFDVIIGIDYGGVPLAVSLSLKTGIPYAILRKEQKLHGMQKRIEGSPIKGRCILLDDVKTTGKSLVEAKDYLNNNDYYVLKSFILLDRLFDE